MVSLRRDIAAYHEAGHAVVAWMLGLRVRSVTIRPASGHSGLTRIAGFGRTTTEKKILITLAGPYTRRRFVPRSAWRSRNQSHLADGYDFDKVALLLDDAHGNGKVADLYSRYVMAKAEQLVDDGWQHIEAVAKALLERETLTVAEMRQVISDEVKARRIQGRGD
jgi:hypothetical protein